jgi:hypothetical protein
MSMSITPASLTCYIELGCPVPPIDRPPGGHVEKIDRAGSATARGASLERAQCYEKKSLPKRPRRGRFDRLQPRLSAR